MKLKHFTASSSDEAKAIKHDLQRSLISSKVLGGDSFDPARFPYLATVSVSTDSSVESKCVGSVVAPNVVITAASCVSTLRSDQVISGITVGGVEYQPGEIRFPDGYSLGVNGKDIVSIELKNANLPNENIISLPRSGLTIPIGLELNVVNGIDVKEVTVAVRDFNQCNINYRNVLDDTVFCASGVNPAEDACVGDAGAPALVTNSNSGEDVQVGLVSFGNGCALEGYPTVYTDLSKPDIAEFIVSFVGDLGESLKITDSLASGIVPTASPVPLGEFSTYPTTSDAFIGKIPVEWECNPAFYAALDGCDCDCGAPDPDCTDPSNLDESVFGCEPEFEFCFNGFCTNVTGSTLAPVIGPVTQAPTVPIGWTCEPFTFGTLDGCDCECGTPDPDCDIAFQREFTFNCPITASCQGGICISSPTLSPTFIATPTNSPTENPTNLPTISPTENPTHLPTTSPTPRVTSPTQSPTENPTNLPTEKPVIEAIPIPLPSEVSTPLGVTIGLPIAILLIALVAILGFFVVTRAKERRNKRRSILEKPQELQAAEVLDGSGSGSAIAVKHYMHDEYDNEKVMVMKMNKNTMATKGSTQASSEIDFSLAESL